MPDSFVLYGPGGASPLQIGSWVRADPGPDFDPGAILKPRISDPAFSEGQVAYEQSGPRQFRFPLTVASGALSLLSAEAILRANARPGGYIDLQPDGVPSAEAVRFDLLAGRWLPAYDLRHQRVTRRMGTLELTVEPFGYWPTWITLASVASVGHTGPLTWTGSVLGDAPGLGRLVVQPTVASIYAAGIVPDFVAWSLAAKPSHSGLLRVASTAFSGDTLVVATYRPVAHAKAFDGATIMQLQLASPAPTQYRLIAYPQIPTALEPAHRGRHRVFLAANTPATGAPVIESFGNVAVDVSDTLHGPMASDAPVATLSSHFSGGSGAALLDLGEITYPNVASGRQQSPYLRFWFKSATVNHAGIPSIAINWQGVYLLPADGPHGILPRGLNRFASGPYLGDSATVYGLDVNAADHTALLRGYTTDLDTIVPFGNALRNYRGNFPLINPSVISLQLLLGQGLPTHQPTVGPGHDALNHAAVSLTYRPRFQFLKGL